MSVPTYQDLVKDSKNLTTMLAAHQAGRSEDDSLAQKYICDCRHLYQSLLLYKQRLPILHSTSAELSETRKLADRIEDLMDEHERCLTSATRHLAVVKKALAKSPLVRLGVPVRDKSLRPHRLATAAHGCAQVLADMTQMNVAMQRFEQVAIEVSYYERIEVAVRLCYGFKKVAAAELLRDDKCLICQELYLDDGGALGQTAVRLPCRGSVDAGHVFHLQCVFLWFKERDCCPCCRDPMLKSQQVLREKQRVQ